MKSRFIALLTIISFAFLPLFANSQSQTFKCFQKNYGEGKGWENANFSVKIDMDNYKISIHDPKLETYIKFGSDSYSPDNGKTTVLQGTDQSGIKCNIFIALTDPPMLTVQYFNKFYQYYRLK